MPVGTEDPQSVGQIKKDITTLSADAKQGVASETLQTLSPEATKDVATEAMQSLPPETKKTVATEMARALSPEDQADIAPYNAGTRNTVMKKQRCLHHLRFNRNLT